MEDAFRISGTRPEERGDLILVGRQLSVMSHVKPDNDLWGRMASCGRLAIGLYNQRSQTRPIHNRPQIDNLPHTQLARGKARKWGG